MRDMMILSAPSLSSETTAAPWAGLAASLGVFGIACLFAVVGILFWPLLIFGVVLMLVAPFMGLSARRGPCPHCGTVAIMLPSRSLSCRGCKHRLILRDRRIYDVTVNSLPSAS